MIADHMVNKLNSKENVKDRQKSQHYQQTKLY